MNRLVVFLLFMTAIVTVLTLRNYKSLPITNNKFDIKKAEEAHEAHKKELVELAERMKPKKVVEEAPVEEGPLVVLDTPQLQSGSDLYKKCIVCHGKRGEGKKSQQAPRLGGQHEGYLASQIAAMRDGKRINQKMMPYVKKLSDQDIKDLAHYISKIPWGK